MPEALLQRIAAIVIPRHCIVCGLQSAAGAICSGCFADLPWIGSACRYCAMPLANAKAAQLGCGRCQRQPWPFDFVVAPLRYAFPLSAMLKACKYRRRAFYARALGALLASRVGERAAGIEAVVPVPLHWRRHRQRGFNQAAELARPLARRLGLPLWQGVRRVRHSPPQSGLTEQQRRLNLSNVFATSARSPWRSVLIVDDVITTGTTVRELAVTLRRAGVRKIAVAAVARAVAGRG